MNTTLNPVTRTAPVAGGIVKRPSAERGHADHGWLDARHTFSFAGYHDRAHMGFRSLRVINQDIVAPGQGFGAHPHRDMEIFSYVLEGAIAHKDSMGNSRTLLPGQIQLMSAGSGVTHSEFNPSDRDRLHLLQIWLHPEKAGLTPSYSEWHPDPAADSQPKVLVISRDGRENSAVIHQDAEVYRLRLQPGGSVTHELRSGRGLWLQVIKGRLTLGGVELEAGDGASTEAAGVLEIQASENSEALLFDLR
ncbi:MAG: pirin family protein [Verrucomicrobiaceae bacterium]|nr:MAG: pirin family protein [Verrucomicrobiaceae bacterium]